MPTLAHVATLTAWLEFDCRRCPRYGRVRPSTLMARFPPETEMHAVIDALAADCPRAGETAPYELCQARCPTLTRIG